MYCSNCGNELKKKEEFCGLCGTPILKKKRDKKKWKKVWTIVVCVVVLFAVGTGAFSIWFWQNAQYKYLAAVKNSEGKWGYINEKQKEIIECKYDFAEDFDENGLAKVGMKNGFDEDGEQLYLYGYVNVQGEEILSCKYDSVSILEKSKRIVVKKNDKDELLNLEGKEIVPCKYDYIWWDMVDGKLIKVSQNFSDSYGCIDPNGKEIVPCIYDEILPMTTRNGQVLLMVADDSDGSLDQKYGILNEKGEEIVPFQEKYFGLFIKGSRMGVEQNGKYGYVNMLGEMVIPAEYDFVSGFGRNGLAVVGKDGNSFVINEDGIEVAECTNSYSYAYSFDENGLAMVRSETGYGWINEEGEEVIPCQYTYCQKCSLNSFEEKMFNDMGLAIVEKDEQYGVINERGEEVIPFTYDRISEFFDNGLTAVEKDGKRGAVNANGEFVLPLEYDYIIGVAYERRYTNTAFYETQNFGSNLIARKNDRVGLFDENGKEISVKQYEKLFKKCGAKDTSCWKANTRKERGKLTQK